MPNPFNQSAFEDERREQQHEKMNKAQIGSCCEAADNEMERLAGEIKDHSPDSQAIACKNCMNWEVPEPPKVFRGRGYCYPFDKETTSNHGDKCTAFEPWQAPQSCDHKWCWSLRSGELWGQPESIESYNTDLIIGKCNKCGQTHKPKIDKSFNSTTNQTP